jgi:hypothetical protein
MTTIILYPLVTTALFYLGSRAMITQRLWSRYPAWLASWADCAACSGAWYGALVAYIGGYRLGLPLMEMPGASAPTVIFGAMASMVWTPIVAAVMQWGLSYLGSTVLGPDVQG